MKRPKSLRYAAVLVLGALVLGGTYRFVMERSSGEIKAVQIQQPAKPTTKWVDQDSQYIRFSRPAVFTAIAMEPVVRPTIEGFTYRDRVSTAPQNLTIQVRELPSGSIADDGDYIYRSRTHGAHRSVRWIGGS